AAGQAAVRGHDHVADPLDLLALDQVGMAELGIGLGQVPDQLPHRPRIRARRLHPILRLADLRGRDHLQRARHLAGVLHALDLGFDFSAAGHFSSRDSGLGTRDPVRPLVARRVVSTVSRCRSRTLEPALAGPGSRAPGPGSYQLPVFLNSSMPALYAASISSFQLPLALVWSISSPWVLAKCACSASSNARTLPTGTSSM